MKVLALLVTLLPLAAAGYLPLLQRDLQAHADDAEVEYVAPDCVCAGVVPDCKNTGLVQQAIDTLLANNCNTGPTTCATNPVCRDAWFYAHAHHELCEGILNEHYHEAFELFAFCPVCTVEDAGKNCSADENSAWEECGDLKVGSGRPYSSCPAHVKMGFDTSDTPCPVVVNVNITNLTFKQDFSPLLVVFHSAAVSLFTEGQPASDAMTLLAEEGDVSGLLDIAADPAVAPYICGATVAEGMTAPGEQFYGRANITYTEECRCGYMRATIVGKLMSTNDAFVGIESIMFGQEAAPHGDHFHAADPTTVYPLAYDAGTEANTEKCSDIPGSACDTDSNTRVEDGAEGIVHVHRGLQGDADIDVDYKWGHSVAKIVIAPRSRY